MPNYPPIGLDDRLRFGKYGPKNDQPGKYLWEVLESDLDYVRWMIDEGIDITDEAYEAYQKRENGDPRW